VKASFSEFSFGFAYTFELAILWERHLVGAPMFPSLIAEGKAGGGYDMKLDSTLGFIYCAQFKRSEFMKRRSAVESKAGYGPMPFYRFSVYGSQTSRQHELLLDLEADGFLVEYVAPLFIEQGDLDRAFSARNVRNRVVRVRPTVIGPLPGRDDHRVACDVSGGARTLYSEPVELERPSDWGAITEDGFELRDVRFDLVSERAEEPATSSPTIRSQLSGFVEKVTRVLGVPQGRFEDLGLGPAEQAQAVARTLLGAELLIVSDAGDPTGEETSP